MDTSDTLRSMIFQYGISELWSDMDWRWRKYVGVFTQPSCRCLLWGREKAGSLTGGSMRMIEVAHALVEWHRKNMVECMD